MRLKTLLVAPPKGWRYYQNETGFWMQAITFETLVRKISYHRDNMKLPQVNPPFATLEAEIEDAICQTLTPKDQLRKCSDAKPLPWPAYLQPFKLLAKEGDRGLGDIIARTVGPVGGEAFQNWYKKTMGRDCGCRDRQVYLNAAYPL